MKACSAPQAWRWLKGLGAGFVLCPLGQLPSCSFGLAFGFIVHYSRSSVFFVLVCVSSPVAMSDADNPPAAVSSWLTLVLSGAIDSAFSTQQTHEEDSLHIYVHCFKRMSNCVNRSATRLMSPPD